MSFIVCEDSGEFIEIDGMQYSLALLLFEVLFSLTCFIFKQVFAFSNTSSGFSL